VRRRRLALDALADLDFARLNHVLIPSRAEDRERLRRSRTGRALVPLIQLYERFTREGQLAAWLALMGTVVSLDVDRGHAHLLWAALVGVLWASLLASAFTRVDAVTLSVTAPPRVAAGEEVAFAVTLHNTGDRAVTGLRVDGPFLPWDGAWTREHPTVPRLAAGAQVTVTCYARFRARGEHHLDRFRVSAVVPFGLCQGPAAYSAGCRFVVVPAVARVASISTPSLSRHQPGGVPRVASTGESFDLRGVRPYRPGDPIRDLHARSWARTGFPVVREYQQEYFRRVAVVVDPDTSGAAHPAVLDALISLAAGLASALGRDDTLVDLVIVGRRLHELNANGGPGADLLGPTLDVLACVEPGAPLDPDAVLVALGPHAGRLSAALVLSVSPSEVHRALGDRLRALGVASRTLIVYDGRKARPAGVDGASALAHDAVLRGEAVRA
jgi:uncharacterized protein (DUF58 family)